MLGQRLFSLILSFSLPKPTWRHKPVTDECDRPCVGVGISQSPGRAVPAASGCPLPIGTAPFSLKSAQGFPAPRRSTIHIIHSVEWVPRIDWAPPVGFLRRVAIGSLKGCLLACKSGWPGVTFGHRASRPRQFSALFPHRRALHRPMRERSVALEGARTCRNGRILSGSLGDASHRGSDLRQGAT